MSDKIIITNDDVAGSDNTGSDVVKEKIVVCELPQNTPEVVSEKPAFPLAWYLILLLPVISVIAVIWACFQNKYKFAYQLPAAIVCLLSTLLPLLLFAQPDESNVNWKNDLARRAPRGVVIVAMEDKGFFRSDSGFGTGVVVAKNGNTALILTNRHVISRSNRRGFARKISVITSSEMALPTEVVAVPRDGNIDMALLLVGNANSLEVLGNIGTFDSIKTGDEVVAIGHPNGLSFTMTQGIVSAVREGMLIQSSASINPGNSGGPLIDSRGRIIGVNTFFIKDTQGLNFAFRADYILNRSAWTYYRNISSVLDKIKLK